MAETRTQRRFTAEFKAQAVKRVLEGGKGLTEVATELGLGTGQLSTWRTGHLAAGSAAALAARKAEEAEMQRLKREVKRLEEENLILRRPRLFSPRGSRDNEVRFRVGRAREPRRCHAVPRRRRERQGFYAWLHAIPTVQVRAEAEAELRGHIGRIFVAKAGATHEICLACRALTYDGASSRWRGSGACRSKAWDGILVRSKTRAVSAKLSTA